VIRLSTSAKGWRTDLCSEGVNGLTFFVSEKGILFLLG
jgi:hypothetical protein